VRVGANRQQRDVEQRPGDLVAPRTKQRVVQTPRVGCGELAADPMNLRGRYRHVLNQGPVGEAEVAVRVVGWNFAFVAPEQLHVTPVDPVPPRTLPIGKELIQEVRRRSTCERQGSDTAGSDRAVDQ
jgi:hypothetical protein